MTIMQGSGGEMMQRQRAMSTGGGDRDRDRDDNNDKNCAWRWQREDATLMRDVNRRWGQEQGWGQ
jgi:hypothetical protein